MGVLDEPGVFDVTDPTGIHWHYQMYGYAVVRGLLTEAEMDSVTTECVDAQRRVMAGELPARYGSTMFLDDAAKAEVFANYVEHVTELSPAVQRAVTDTRLVAMIRQLLGTDIRLGTGRSAGIVYQDARPGRESGYTRIGWHSDWQSAPSLDIWPATAFTIHIDATSPQNGFLRVVPGSQLWATPAPYRNINNVEVPATARPAGGRTATPPPFPMPLGFEKVRGEIPVYAERGDVLLHDAYLWHSAARATDDDTTRRHVRGGYFTGAEPAPELAEEFIKNAAR
ncbi:phytanoyl-CoA dioxygenase family protein [Nocardia sp. BMG111209]|uniref:phytanoyl-CoA dioxygenase family protein n=1 Tax=Nocardia sp. BMG111209 TaxID=1160137 RepID=UPI000361E5CC|nr:phytanoyl-CoA dioxygenase family protein [Nocardia sp. BMG111209]